MITVSICCITYNHDKFIRKALDSFLAQETNFNFEIIIYDDASTDDTASIIQEYVNKYPQKVFALLQKENQYSKGVRGMNPRFNYNRSKGKYIALCEGDDYWIDNKKLQKQVNFLEANKTYVFTCSGFKTIDMSTSKIETSILTMNRSGNSALKGFDITQERSKKQWLTKTLTTLFLASAIEIDDLIKYKYTRDVHLFYYLMKKGRGFYMKEALGMYRKHEGGIHTSIDIQNRKYTSYLIYKEIYSYHKEDKFIRKAYFNSLSYILIYFDEKFGKKDTLIKELLKISKGITEHRIAISLLLKNKLKKK